MSDTFRCRRSLDLNTVTAPNGPRAARIRGDRTSGAKCARGLIDVETGSGDGNSAAFTVPAGMVLARTGTQAVGHMTLTPAKVRRRNRSHFGGDSPFESGSTT